MLKYFFFILFLMPLCFFKDKFWMVQNLFFMMFFLMIFYFNYQVIFSNFSYLFSMDLMSYGLVILSIWICGLMIMASEKVFKYKNFSNYFLVLILFLLLMLVLTFSTINLFMFYLFFESSLIPTLFLILGWGYQPERLQAGLYLLFYTLLASLPLLVSIFYMLSFKGSLLYFMLIEKNIMLFFFYLAMVFAFLVKMPMFLVHLWLPKAHVEAPVSGSMILAGVLLKLGGYGLLRIFMFLSFLGISMNFFWVSISLLGGCLISFVCLRQMDVKSLIAYSSVVHMGIVLSGLMTMTSWGMNSAYTLMIAHGLCSSGLFCLANISYERLGSRSLMINKGLLNFLPSMSLWWFLLCSGNMAAPPTLNLLGEISLFNSIISWSFFSILLLSILSFFSAAYSLYLYSYSQQGKIFSSLYSFSMNYSREYLVLLLHWLPLNLLVLKSDMCFIWM